MKPEPALLSRLVDLLLPGCRGDAASNAALARRLRSLADELEAPAASDLPAAELEAPALGGEAAAGGDEEDAATAACPPPPRRSPIDLSRYPQTLVALELFYAGWPYHGFATQGDGPGCAETVETHLFAALRTTRLVPPDATWAAVEYSRCGRTDRGVSAVRQVVALRVRAAAEGAPPLDYVGALCVARARGRRASPRSRARGAGTARCRLTSGC